MAARKGEGKVGLDPGLSEDVKLDMETLDRSDEPMAGKWLDG